MKTDANDILRKYGADALRDAFDNAEDPFAERSNGAHKANVTDSHAEPPLKWIDMSKWDTEPRPEREWAVPNRVPLRQGGLFSGEGGTGKSIIEMMRDVAHVTAKDWLGSLPEPGPGFYSAQKTMKKKFTSGSTTSRALRRHVQRADRRRAARALPARPGRDAVRRSREERPDRNDKLVPADL